MSRLKFTDFTDHQYHLTTNPRRQPLPMSPVGEQIPWDANIRNIIRRQISKLCCEDKRFVEGVKVQRTAAFNTQSYTVQREKVTYTLEAAVDRVVEIMQEREQRYK